MIKVKDGYGKLIGTTYKGSATQVLLSNGGNLEFSSGTKANTLVLRNASLHIYATYFNSAISDEALTDIGSVYVRNTSDTFIRRISKTQFYSIIDNKFVTLDTALTITGMKTFSTGPILANNAIITLNLNSTSNYTTVVKWLKGGVSLGTYNPSIGQHNTGGDGTGSICILPYPTETSPWNGTVGLFISKGVLRLDGKAVAIADNYYTKTESDNRYVNVTGDTMTGPLIVKASITGTLLISNVANGTAPLKVTSKTVVTNLNSDLLDGYHETSFFRARGSLTIAGSIPTTTELSSNNNLSGNWNVSFPGASGHLVQFNTGGGSTRYMQFYSHYSGSLYWRNSTDSTLNTKSWKTIVDSANYTGIVLKIGTTTKGSATLPIYLNAGTPTACSTTLGVSITGNAATATKLKTARTINGTSFNGTANITTAYWGATRTITLSGAVTGSASVNGSLNVTITTTYQTGSIDGRYVGGKKQQGHGSQGTAYTADTYSSNFVNKAFVAYAERGSWSYANNGYITTNTGVNIPLAGTAIFQWGASDTNKTLLFITPHNNSGVSNPAANEMLFYTSNGSGYTSAWTRVLTHRNYTTYTVTKTGGGASGTWGISITGTAAAARKIYKIDGTSRTWSTANSIVGNGLVSYTDASTSGRWDSYGSIFQFSNTDNPTPGTNGHWLTQIWSGTSNKLGVRWRTNTGGWSAMLTILTNTNYVSYADTRYVTALGTNGNYVTWTKNGTTNNLTVPYATASIRVNSSSSVLNTGLTYYSSSSFVVGGTAARGQWGMPSDSLDASYKNGQCLRMYWSSTYYTDILSGPNSMGTTHGLYLRLIVNGSVATGTFPGGWRLLLDSYNYQRYGDSRYVTLATNLTVSGIKTFSRQLKFTVATGTSPFTVSSTTVVSNLNADLLDGWHLNYILKDGYVTSGTSGLSSYWRKVWDITLNNLYNDVDINLFVHSAYNLLWGIISFRLRQNGTGTAKNISAYLAEIVGNIPLDRFRLYYNNSSGLCLLWCNPNGLYNVYNYRVLAKTWRTGTEATTLGTFYTGNTTTAQTLPSGSYVSMTGITIVNTAAKVANTLTFSAGKFSSKTYNGSAAVTVNIPTHTSHLTNNSGFLTGNVIRAVSANGYWGMADPSSNAGVWIRTTNQGIIPYQSGGAGNGHQSLGTSGWYFKAAYIDNIYGTASNADKLDGYHANTSQNPFGKIPIVTSSGVMEVGRYLDFHYNSSDTSDYRTRLLINHNSGSYTATLPAKSGTLAMTSDIPTVTNYYWANIRVSTSSSTSTSPTFNNITVNSLSTLKGNTYMQGASYLKNSAQYPCINFMPSFGSSTLGTIYYNAGSTTSYTASKFFFRLYSYSNGSRLSYYEDYNFPNTNSGRTSNAYYYILTTKNTSVSGGGSSWGSSITVTINGTSKTLTIPSNPNTDTKVTNILNNTKLFYITGTSSSSTNTGTLYFDSGVYVTSTSGLLSTNTIVSRSNAYVGNHLYLRNGQSGTYADLLVNTAGTTSTTGVTYLLLGNKTSSGSTNNALGILRLYGTSSGYTNIRCGTNNTSGYTLYLPGATGQLVYHTNDTTIGSSTKGVYIASSGAATAMTYSLNATVNSGSSGKLAYYSGTNSIDDYTSTKGSSSTPIYLNAGVPTACTGVLVKLYANYDIECLNSSARFSRTNGNFSPISSVSRMDTGKVKINFASGYNWLSWFVFAVGRMRNDGNSPDNYTPCYVSLWSQHPSYLIASILDDSSRNDGSFHFYILVF